MGKHKDRELSRLGAEQRQGRQKFPPPRAVALVWGTAGGRVPGWMHEQPELAVLDPPVR